MRDQITDFYATATKNLTEANERMLDGVVETNRKVVEFAVKAADQFAAQLGELPIQLPYADRFPTPAETGERYIEFVERAVEVNRDFADRVTKLIATDAPKAAEKAATSAKSTASKAKSTATKTRKSATAKRAAAKK